MINRFITPEESLLLATGTISKNIENLGFTRYPLLQIRNILRIILIIISIFCTTSFIGYYSFYEYYKYYIMLGSFAFVLELFLLIYFAFSNYDTVSVYNSVIKKIHTALNQEAEIKQKLTNLSDLINTDTMSSEINPDIVINIKKMIEEILVLLQSNTKLLNDISSVQKYSYVFNNKITCELLLEQFCINQKVVLSQEMKSFFCSIGKWIKVHTQELILLEDSIDINDNSKEGMLFRDIFKLQKIGLEKYIHQLEVLSRIL